MSTNKTIGGELPQVKLCKDCREWRTGGRCELWKKYAYGFAPGCGYFMRQEREAVIGNK